MNDSFSFLIPGTASGFYSQPRRLFELFLRFFAGGFYAIFDRCDAVVIDEFLSALNLHDGYVISGDQVTVGHNSGLLLSLRPGCMG